MAESIPVAPGVIVPAAALSLRTTRSSGPGGQNVNKVASKVELRVDLDRVEGLTEEARARLRSLVDGRLDAQGRLLVTSQRTRDQRRNLEDAREKVRAVVRRAMVTPRPRRPTRVSAGAVATRLARKRQRSLQKRARGAVHGDDD
jgi:ribosome-associated protein